MNATKCPTREVLLAYHTGELAEVSADEVIGHLGQCPQCQAMVSAFGEAEDSLIASLRRPPVQELYTDEPQCRELIERAKAMVEGTLSNVAPEAGTSVKGPRREDLPPTELFGGSASSAQAVAAQLREYRILEKLGQGGMGTVYKALHTKLDKLVALKILPAAAMQDAELVARFEREMKAVGKLEHPHIVRAMDAGCHEGTHFLVMEYVDGLDLAEIVKRCGPLRIADACEVIRQAALGLRHADEHALVHRDIKPSNLVLSPDGEVKILDLGLALLQAERTAGEEPTGHGRAMGTVDYMAPEQARDSHLVDIRADIYSLGCTLYKLLTGTAPFSGPKYKSSFDKMMAHVSQLFPAIRQSRPDVPEKLAAVLERMVAKDRDARYAKASQVVADLKAFCPGCDLAGLLSHARKAAHAKVVAPVAPATPPALGGGLATPPKRPTARSLESPPAQPEGRSVARPAASRGQSEVKRPTPPAGRPVGRGEGEVKRPSPSAGQGQGGVQRPAPGARPVPSAPAPQKTTGGGAFDPYYKWLGIPPEEQPPNHYRLLGITLFEEDREVIQSAASGRSAHLKTLVLGKHQAESQRLLNEVQVAKICLLTPEDKSAYDARLRQKLAAKAASAPFAAAPALGAGLPTPPNPPTGRSPAAFAPEDERDTFARLVSDMDASPPTRLQPARPKGWSAARLQAVLRRVPPAVQIAIACACAAAVVLLGVIIYITTGSGTVKIVLSDPAAKVDVKIDGNQIAIEGLKDPLRLKVGEHSLEVKSGEFESVSQSFVVHRGKEEVVRVELQLMPLPGGAEPRDGQGERKSEAAPGRATARPSELGIDDTWFEGISPDTEEIHLTGKPVTDEGLVHLRRFPRVKTLGLALGPKIEGEGLRHLKGLKNLQVLMLCETRMGDAGLEHIQRLTQLETLSLHGTRVTDKGLAYLSGLTRLRELKINHGPKIAGEGLRHLKGLVKLQVLMLCGTEMGDEGLEHIQGLTQLEVLSLHGTRVTDNGLAHLSSLSQLRALWICFGPKLSGEGLRYLNGLRNLQSLNLADTEMGDAGLKHIQGLTQLEVLSLHGTRVTDEGLTYLSGLIRLRELIVCFGPKISGEGLRHLKGLKNLQSLNLIDTEMGDAGLEHIQALPQLETLVLNGTRVSDRGLAYLNDLPRLRELHLCGGPQITDAGLASLGALAKLQELTLASTQVSDAGLEHLKQLQELRVLALGKTRVTDKGLKALCALAKLENLDVSETAVTAEGLKTLKTALPGCNVSGGTPPK